MSTDLHKGSEAAIRTLMPSRIESVASTIGNCEAFMKRHSIGSTLGAAVVLRELLNNAVVHGNRNAASRNVGVTVEFLGADRFRFLVEDEGEGFDMACVDTALPDDPRTVTKRGYILINSLTERLEFNETGNRVTAYVVLPEEES